MAYRQNWKTQQRNQSGYQHAMWEAGLKADAEGNMNPKPLSIKKLEEKSGRFMPFSSAYKSALLQRLAMERKQGIAS